jgi:hypothetical protein
MFRLLSQTTLIALIGLSASAGYVPPPDSPYWCYQACIAPNYSNHSQCIDECYGSESSSGVQTDADPNCQTKNSAQTRGAACCSWGENIGGCMPGC